ncbi:glycosyltransferase [Acaryochloris sp. IP29b_bin.137]|uniref:glycosyltransferase n=1 Tax=Acaryochloris sp. IP29b_bin.137 TaxID=2969217 RepID=UPI002612724E|nr:glycosyltransferase [Acaryochloris sp. IP29b_bin.137]
MRFVFLIPDLKKGWLWRLLSEGVIQSRSQRVNDWFLRQWLYVDEVFGGTMNIMRHCWVARQCGAEAVLATISGQDNYGDVFGLNRTLPYIAWRDRQPQDICIVPDFATLLINDVEGIAIAYEQSPLQTKTNFDYRRDNVFLWTDSALMQGICAKTYPDKPAEIVPNIVDNELFPFIPQAQREQGLLFAFPRKGKDFILETQALYQQQGGAFWQFERVDGISLQALAQQFRRPQAFLASATSEGCALPPQEAMAAGIVVVGKTARGANFCMEHGKTALTGETPAEVVQCLFQLEDQTLRNTLAQNGHDYIAQYFPDRKPAQFWQQTIKKFM